DARREEQAPALAAAGRTGCAGLVAHPLPDVELVSALVAAVSVGRHSDSLPTPPGLESKPTPALVVPGRSHPGAAAAVDPAGGDVAGGDAPGQLDAGAGHPGAPPLVAQEAPHRHPDQLAAAQRRR